MIHIIKELDHRHIGLNIIFGTWRRPWVLFQWVWYDLATRQVTSRRLRIRFFMRSFILTSKDTYSVVDGWLNANELVPVYRVMLEDQCPWMIEKMQIYKAYGYPPADTEIKLTKEQALSIL